MDNNNAPIIVWLRNDLRLIDNPALYNAAYGKTPIIPIYIYDPKSMDRDFGSAQKWWLHNSLHALRRDFKKYDIDLIVKQGDSLEILNDLITSTNAKGVYWNRCYEAWSIDRDSHIKEVLKERDLDVQSFKANLLFEPWEVETGSGNNYRVFTPYWKSCRLKEDEIKAPLPIPNSMINGLPSSMAIGDISNLNLLPTIRWDDKMKDQWDISEDGAWKRMQKFFDHGLDNYKDGRDCPSQDWTSRLSPYLRWGMISPRSIWHETNAYCDNHDIKKKNQDNFLSEIGWREFSHHLLYYYPNMKSHPLQEKFEKFPWKHNKQTLDKWQRGQTGYPLVDAGMRQLWQTGWMHNRVRMLVGSLLVKHLLHSWVEGEKWFWDTLVDACPANNTAGWQWIGGCGADAAPYFRIFNPITQGDKFDAYDYVREFVPELKDMPDKFLFNPWDAPEGELKMAGVKLGETYANTIISHTDGRERAMEAFKSIKGE